MTSQTAMDGGNADFAGAKICQWHEGTKVIEVGWGERC
jgi:hypothetical protein